jgi:hypothetical protein
MSNKALLASSVGGAIVSWLPIIETTLRIFGSVVAALGGLLYLLLQWHNYRNRNKTKS